MPWHERACACRFARSCTVIIDQWRQDWCLPWEHLLPLLDMATWRLEYDAQRLRLWKGRRYYSEWLLLRPSCMSTGFDSWRQTDGFGNENSEWGGNWWCRWRWEQVLSTSVTLQMSFQRFRNLKNWWKLTETNETKNLRNSCPKIQKLAYRVRCGNCGNYGNSETM